MKKLLTLAAGLLLTTAAFAQKGVLIIDAGHGGEDAGAIAATGMAEKQFNLQLAEVLQKQAAAAGYTVVMTREGDSNPSLEARAALRDKYKGARTWFISLHTDVSTNEAARGLTIHYDEKTAPLSATWRQKLNAGLQSLGAVESTPAGLAVLRGASIPALCVSPGYISNIEDMQRIADPAYQERVAKLVLGALE